MTSDWMFHCYILKCADGSYYVGHTDDMEKRLVEHRSGVYTGYTYKRRPVELFWNDAFQTRDDAKAAEKQIKGWSRAKKVALAQGDWKVVRNWPDAAVETDRRPSTDAVAAQLLLRTTVF